MCVEEKELWKEFLSENNMRVVKKIRRESVIETTLPVRISPSWASWKIKERKIREHLGAFDIRLVLYILKLYSL